jgi:hypothetical protein
MRDPATGNWSCCQIERLSSYGEYSMKSIITVVAVAWLASGCAALTAPDDDSATGANFDTRTGLCSDATPAPCTPPRD